MYAYVTDPGTELARGGISCRSPESVPRRKQTASRGINTDEPDILALTRRPAADHHASVYAHPVSSSVRIIPCYSPKSVHALRVRAHFVTNRALT